METLSALPQWANQLNFLVPLFFAFYICLCSFLRFQRRDAMQKKFNFPGRQSLSGITNVDAQAIIMYLLELEFPRLYYTLIQFALFKTYGISIISKLLVATREFSTLEKASKRYADTSILISEL